MGFPWQEYRTGQPFPSPGDLPNSEIELRSPALQADSLPSELPGSPSDTSDDVATRSGKQTHSEGQCR